MDVEDMTFKYGTGREWLRELLGEFLGTFILVFMGNCSVSQSMLSSKTAGESISIHFAYGFAVTLAILVSGGSSGAHLNPAVTVALAIVGKFRWQKMFHYLLGQYCGAFVAAVMQYVVYFDALKDYASDERLVTGDKATASMFATYPQEFLTLHIAFIDQVMGTLILMLVVCAITDRKNMEIHKCLYALYVGITVITIGMSLGYNCGYAINPARDWGPRTFACIAGWGTRAFVYRDFYWIPQIGPHVGAILGAVIYVFAIEIHLTELQETRSNIS